MVKREVKWDWWEVYGVKGEMVMNVMLWPMVHMVKWSVICGEMSDWKKGDACLVKTVVMMVVMMEHWEILERVRGVILGWMEWEILEAMGRKIREMVGWEIL